MPERGAFADAGSGGIDSSKLSLMRVDRFITQRLAPAVIRATHDVELAAWRVGGEPVPFSTARTAPYEPFTIGTSWGAPWDTVWFRIRGDVPSEWRRPGLTVELDVDLGVVSDFPGFQAEGLVHRSDGSVVKGVHPENSWVPIDDEVSTFELYLEAAANPYVAGDFSFLPTPLGDPSTAGTDELYVLRTLRLVARDEEVWELLQDVRTLRGLAAELPPSSPRRAELLLTLERIVDAVDPDDVASTVSHGRELAAQSLARPATASAHRVLAVGHAHIDTAWLWPTRETVRKVARTFANVLDLLDRDADFVFAASSAQQYAWVRDAQPELFERVRAAVAEGRFVPVGGMWVESDTNLPSGESLARQLAYGKRFFLDEFGVETSTVWLPDSFGYTAALPQLITASGSRWFLTQKISWNDTNRMPNHSFRWEGIDGTRVFTHFPPTDTYSSDLSAGELALAERQFDEGGRANTSLALFGWGDGGGGPTREMLAAAHRAADLEGSPRVELAGPEQFFSLAEAEYVDPAVWAGELYLELHRGVYTSQARLKRANRRAEALLREAELWSATAAVRTGHEYPAPQLDSAWRTVLLNQFHDILPGSSIAWVNREAERAGADVLAVLESLVDAALTALAGSGETELGFNAGPGPRSGVPALAAGHVNTRSEYVDVERVPSGFVLSSPIARAVLDANGMLASLVDVATGRELVPAGMPGLALQLFRDTPRQWDAWDVDREALDTPRDVDAPESIDLDAEARAVVIRRRPGDSTIVQRVRMHRDTGALEVSFDIDWHEREKLLKLAFPLDLRTDRATSEIQFGHVHRPVHANTSWDRARFETPAQRWVHVGEPGLGVAIANDVAYGHDIRTRSGPDDRPVVVPRVSLLRSARFPDPEADQGQHEFTISLRIVADLDGAIDEGYRLHLPVRLRRGAGAVEPLLTVDGHGVIAEAVKLADDGSGDVVVRLYESRGARALATLTTTFDWSKVSETDLLERDIPDTRVIDREPDSVRLDLPAFTVCTLRFARPSAHSEERTR
ncbi:alpha-mannosidase [Microcella pacifica]|uniref:Alpha-mannosidase n=1 Tax=Microcella pacifica TaxID=2591847 RepID=A0A9E5JMF4_9MICO|nr:glycoside hydrolase family 38 C-terminal domain-containing protein [Microcella pacifica]NHF62334.1 alpha-mannosidase [Microcella pacifica]